MHKLFFILFFIIYNIKLSFTSKNKLFEEYKVKKFDILYKNKNWTVLERVNNATLFKVKLF